MMETLEQLQASTLGSIFLVLAAVALAHVWLRSWVRRRVREDEAAGAEVSSMRHWLVRGLVEVAPAVLLVFWIHGAYLAINLLIQELEGTRFVAPAMAALSWGYGLGLLAALYWLLSRLGRLIETMMNSLTGRLETGWDDVMLPVVGRVARRMLPLLALLAAGPVLPVSAELEQTFHALASLLLIGVVGFLLYQAVQAGADLVLSRHRLDVADNLRARAIHTQVMVLKKVAVTIIGVFTLASMLMVFESARQFGASILASAGIAGIIVGFAAQRSIATLLAGFQIAITQPIRVDDVVIVENEWGRIEEITLTYVVVRIWDLRRLVLPITYFIERPFQNWTRTSADLLAPVYLHVDYNVPIEALREEFTRILKSCKKWDGKVNVLQVTDSKEHTLEIRALASAPDASSAWDLRCEIRERLIQFVQRNYPDSLPRIRASLETRLPAEQFSPAMSDSRARAGD